MGIHKEWRKVAKKIRRKKLRKKEAEKRVNQFNEEQKIIENSPSYKERYIEEELLEKFQEDEEKRLKQIEEEKWIQREIESQKLWQETQEKILKIQNEKARQDQLIREEWEREQKIIEEKKRQIKEQEELKQKQQEFVQKQLEEFIVNGGPIPSEINVSVETNPDKPICPFFQKTGACRFKDFCSRNHVRPGVSQVLLIAGFYSHFGMQHFNHEEYSSDVLLEYDDHDTYVHFREFFDDVLPEFEKIGNVVQFKVCCNFEPHLRGNVYVEYEEVREAVRAYQVIHGRWYGGKQLNAEFVNISSWKQAICGLFFKKRCPKGNSCNFLHVFQNPSGKFSEANRDLYKKRDMLENISMSAYRWSESPERTEVEQNIYNKTNRKSNNSHSSLKRKKSDRLHSKEKKRKSYDKTCSSSSNVRSNSNSRNSSNSKRYQIYINNKESKRLYEHTNGKSEKTKTTHKKSRLQSSSSHRKEHSRRK